MFQVTVSAEFTAQHQIWLPAGGLEPLHGHTWHVQVTYEGPELDERGLLVDFVAARGQLRDVLAALDGRNLNTTPVLAGRNPSAEVVAEYVARHLTSVASSGPRLRCVEVEEEPGCWARYLADPPTGSVAGAAGPSYTA